MVSDQHVPGLDLETDGAQALAGADACQHLGQLLGLRDWLTRLQRTLFETNHALDESKTAARKEFVTMAATIVAIVDELRRLLDEANTAVGFRETDPAPRKSKRGFLRFRRREQAEPPSVAGEWLRAIQRSVGAAVTKLETLGIRRVELIGQDLRGLNVKGQPLKPWVSVKNRPRGESLLVREELQGLWLAVLEEQLIPVQRGEVLVK